MENKIKAILVKIEKEPEVIEMNTELETLQHYGGGYVQCYNFDKGVSILCDEEGKIKGLPMNRKVNNDFIVGDFLIVADDIENEDFTSLTSEQIDKYMKQFDKDSIIFNVKDEDKIKFLVSGIKSNEEKQKLEELGLYCYDLRDSDDGRDIASIEKRVVVNRIGTMITDKEIKLGDKYPNDFVDYNTFVEQNIQVDTIKELLEKNKDKTNERGR